MSDNDRQTLGREIARARRARKMSQQELADAIGVSVKVIGNAENDRTRPTPNNLAAIYRVLDMDPDPDLTREAYPRDVKVMADVVATALSQMTDSQRERAYREITLLLWNREW